MDVDNDRQKINEIINWNTWFYSSFPEGRGFFKVKTSGCKGPILMEGSGAWFLRKKKNLEMVVLDNGEKFDGQWLWIMSPPPKKKL